MLLVVELQLDLVSDLVDEDLSQQDAHQLQERGGRGRRGKDEEEKERRVLMDTRQHHPTILQVVYTSPGDNVPNIYTAPQILP